jgi:hypothetical protein
MGTRPAVAGISLEPYSSAPLGSGSAVAIWRLSDSFPLVVRPPADCAERRQPLKSIEMLKSHTGKTR